MKMIVVSIHDKVSMAFSRPVFVATEGVAVRSFQDEIRDKNQNGDLQKHPDDFALYVVGEFDDSDGSFVIPAQPRLLISGSSVI